MFFMASVSVRANAGNTVTNQHYLWYKDLNFSQWQKLIESLASTNCHAQISLVAFTMGQRGGRPAAISTPYNTAT